MADLSGVMDPQQQMAQALMGGQNQPGMGQMQNPQNPMMQQGMMHPQSMLNTPPPGAVGQPPMPQGAMGAPPSGMMGGMPPKNPSQFMPQQYPPPPNMGAPMMPPTMQRPGAAY